MTVNTSDNRYGTAQLIVAPTIAEGANYTTIASALTAASSGQTIFIRPGTYTEDLTLKAGVNLTAYSCDPFTPNVTIIGKGTFTTAGTVTISNIKLQTNADFFLAVTGSAASNIFIVNCYLNCSNNTGISYTSSSSTSKVTIKDCYGELGTTGIAFIVATGAGAASGGIEGVLITNTYISAISGSSTPNSSSVCQVRMINSKFFNPWSVTGTGSIDVQHSSIECENQNATCVTTAGTGTSNIINSYLISGTASAISVGAGTTMQLYDTIIGSANTNAVTGAGLLTYSNITFNRASSVINTTTQTPGYVNLAKYKASGQPCFMAYSSSTQTDVTGDGSSVTIVFGTERFDLDNNFDGTSTFTAPVTGKYLFNVSLLLQDLVVANTITVQLITTAETYVFGNFSGVPAAGNFAINFSVIADMTATDTATVQLNVGGGAKVTDVYGLAGDPRTWFCGHLVA